MSTNPVVNPANTSPSVIAQELYAAYIAQAKLYNNSAEAAYAQGVATAEAEALPVPSPPMLQTVSLTAIQAMENATNQAAIQAAASQIIGWIPAQAIPTPPPAAPYSLGKSLGRNLWILLASANFPSSGTVIQIGGQNYLATAITPFEFVAQLVP